MSYRSPNAYLDSHPFTEVRKNIKEILMKHLNTYPFPPCNGTQFVEAVIPEAVKDSMRILHGWNSYAMSSDCNPDFHFPDMHWQTPYNPTSSDGVRIRISIPSSVPYRTGSLFTFTDKNTPDSVVISGYKDWLRGYLREWNKCCSVYLYVTGALCATNTPGQLLNLWPSLAMFLDEHVKQLLSSRVRTSPAVRDVAKREFLDRFYTDEVRAKADQLLTMAMLVNSTDPWYRNSDMRLLRHEMFGESSHLFDSPPTEVMIRAIGNFPSM